jgi:hypothetical protein
LQVNFMKTGPSRSRTFSPLFVHALGLALLGVFSGAATAHAQQQQQQQQPQTLGFRGWGLRGGATIDPDQIHVGAHINAGEFAPRVRFQPSFEVGFGNDVILGAINLDALYTFRRRSWRPYLGGGLGVALVDSDRNGGDDDFDVEAGLNLVAGFEWGPRRRYLLEIRAGVGDIPNFKVTAGIGL